MKTTIRKGKPAKAMQQRLLDWCAGWYTLDPARRCPLEQWIMLKLGVGEADATAYARWMNERQQGA